MSTEYKYDTERLLTTKTKLSKYKLDKFTNTSNGISFFNVEGNDYQCGFTTYDEAYEEYINLIK